MASALPMLRRCGQHQAEGEGISVRDLAPVVSVEVTPTPTGTEDLPPSDIGCEGVDRSLLRGEADEQVARLEAGG